MGNIYFLTKNEFIKVFRIFLSYKLNLLGQLLIALITISIVILGVKKIFGNPTNFYSVLLIPTIGSAISSLGNSYKFDNLIGVTEQIFTSQTSIFKINTSRYLLNYSMSIIPTMILIFFTNIFFDFDVNIFYLVISLLLVGILCYYISVFLWSINLLFRDIDSLNTIISILIAGSLLSVMFIKKTSILFMIQMIPCSSLIMISTIPFSIFKLSPSILLMIILNYIISIIILRFCYKKLYKLSKLKGTIGMY